MLFFFFLLQFLFLVLFCREIVQPRDMVTIPADDSNYMHFCGQFCLSVFRHKRKNAEKIPDKWADKRLERKPDKPPQKQVERQAEKPFCSVCKVTNKVRETLDYAVRTHMVTFSESLLLFSVLFLCWWLGSSLQQIEHEVTHQGRLHRLCSDACFFTWRKMRQLAMNCCEGCGLYCNSNSGSCQTLTIERSQLNFCGPTCIGTYKQVSICVKKKYTTV